MKNKSGAEYSGRTCGTCHPAFNWKKMAWGLVVFVLLQLLWPGSGFHAAPLDGQAEPISDIALQKSIVQLKVYPVSRNYLYPWSKRPGQPLTVFGIVVPHKRVLVRAEDVRSAVLMQARKYSSYELAEAKVEHLDMESNLALVTIDQPGFFDDLLALPAGPDLAVGATAVAVKLDSVFQAYREDVRIQRQKVVADFGFTHLPVQVCQGDADFASGGLIIAGHTLRGMVAYAKSGTMEILPVSVMNEYRKRALVGQPAFASAGFYLGSMIDPARREYYQMPANLSGALVKRVLPGTSAWNVLQKNDVLLAIDGKLVDNAGYIGDAQTGQKLPALMHFVKGGSSLRHPGDVLQLQVLRKGQQQTLEMTLKAYRGGAERIPWLLNEEPPYLLEGGFLFLELSLPLLRQVYGSDWKGRNPELSMIFNSRQFYTKPGQDRIVILAQVFPDPVTRGFEGFRMQPVRLVNGKAPFNLTRMRKIIADQVSAGQAFLHLELSGGQQIVVDLQNRDQINQRIKERYAIPANDT
ncbi:MAG: hypothetical protein KDK39_05855 [Leptospiraceae bacterium]|nr:hypothetical protein [Leptospiraceae bacterium]